jgi:hypothetical protein
VEGAYANASPSGLIAGVAAGTATNGHLWAFRWPTPTDARQFAIIQRLRIRATTIAGYTAAQEVRLSLFKLTGYSASHTGGVAAVVPSTKRTGTAAGVVPPSAGAMPASLAVIQVANTGQLTAGTQVIDGDPIKGGSYSELAAAATVAKGAIEIFFSTEDIIRYPIVLQGNEGLLLRNEVAQGAGGSMRLIVEAEWFEVERQTEVHSS